MNLTQYINEDNVFDFIGFMKDVELANETLDNVVEFHGLALDAQKNEIITKRRHGLGYTGLGSMFHMMGIDYGSDESVELTEAITFSLAFASLKANVALAKEKGEFDLNDEPTIDIFKDSEFYRNIIMNKEMTDNKYLHDADIKKHMKKAYDFIIDNVEEHGLRFSHSTSIAPTGTISLISNNVSNGIEPPFAGSYVRNVTDVKNADMKKSERIMDYAFMLAFEKSGMEFDEFNKEYSKTHKFAMDIKPSGHIRVQAAAQKYIDSSISKTVNIPTDMKFDDFKQVYIEGFDAGLKGLTTFRFNPEVRSAILITDGDLDNMNIQFTMSDGTVENFKGSDKVEYDGNELTAYNVYDMLK